MRKVSVDNPQLRGRIGDFVARIAGSEERAPLSEHKMMRLGGSIDIREVAAIDDSGLIAGYAQAAWHRGSLESKGHWAIEMVTGPEHRDGATTAALVEAVMDEIGDDGAVLLWARAEDAIAAATALHWEESRRLLQMRRALPLAEIGAAPPWLTVRPFRMSVDERAWLEANNAAFAGHPENGNMARRDLENRMSQEWFEPEGLLLGWAGERLVASCWTKIHHDGSGEIYIIGVIPEYMGKGLGRVMLERGLDYLGRVRGVRNALLYVEASNRSARHLYAHMGFEVTTSVRAFSPPS